MTSIFQVIALIIIVFLMMFVFLFFTAWFFVLMLFVLVIAGVAYLGNVRISVSKDGKKIGTYTRKGGFEPS